MLRSRLYIGMTPVVGILTLLGAFFIFNQNQQLAQIDELQNNHYAATSGLDRLQFSVSEIERVISIKETVDPNLINWIYETKKSDIQSWLDEQGKYLENTQEDTIREITLLLNSLLEETHRFLVDGDKDIIEAINKTARGLDDAVLTAKSWHNDRIDSINEDIKNRTRTQFYVIILGIVSSVVAIGIIAYTMSRRILEPIDKLTQAATSFSDQDWETDYKPSSKDEIASLEQAFLDMAGRIREYKRLTSRKMVQIRRRMEACFDRLPHPVLFVNTQHKLIYKNPAGSRLTEALGDVDTFPTSLKESISNTFSTGEHIVPTEFEESIAIKVENEEEYFLPIVIRINSEEKELVECALILQNVTNLRLSDELKSDMVATVSHEIKTPVTSATMALHLLLEKGLGDLNENQEDMVKTAVSDLQRLNRILDHLLDIARIENHNFIKKQSINLPALFKQLVEAHSMSAREKSIELDLEVETGSQEVLADPDALEVAISNFISNALKFSPENTKILIYARKQGNTIRMGVQDEGPGIAPEDLDKIFDKFYRCSPKRNKGGVGLGLSIVKEIAQGHHGIAGCHLRRPNGCDFWIEIPAA